MLNIGKFIKQENGNIQGHIRTLTINANKVTISPINNPSDKGPEYRILVNGAEIGAGWIKTSKAGNNYISVKIDDPSLSAAIYANLIEDGDHYNLLWSR